jgi:hypothetical protein
MRNGRTNENVLMVVILALMLSLSASVMMFGGQTTELLDEDIVNAAAFHQDEYQIQYTMDFFRAGPWDNGGRIVVNDAATSSDGVTYVVGTLKETNWMFDGLLGSVGDAEKGFVAALTAAGAWSWVRVDISSTGTSSLNAIDLTNDGSLIVGGTFFNETSWPDQLGGISVLPALSGGFTSPFAFNMDESGETSWLEPLLGTTRIDASLNDVAVDGDAAYATGSSFGRMFPGDPTRQADGDLSGDAYVVKFAVQDGQVSHTVDSCTENDAGTGYCNPDGQIIPRESGDALTVLQDGSILVAVSYDKETTFGANSTPAMNEATNNTTLHSDIAVWKLSNNLISADFSAFETNRSDTVVGIEERENGKYYLATNADFFQGRLLEIDAGLQLTQVHTATSGNLKIIDITVDSGNLELVGFGSEDGNGNPFVFEGQSYNPTNNASMFVAEYSDAGFEYGQAMDLSPTKSWEFLSPPTTSITSQGGSIRVVTVSMPVFVYAGPTVGFQRVNQPISFGGTDMVVSPNLGIVAHFEWDSDQDGIPNRLDPYDDDNDPDHDGIDSSSDNCPAVWNSQQENNDDDNEGDVCDLDDDNDGLNDTDDSCPFIPRGANDADDDGCPDAILVGCMDPTALNYTDLANVNSTTCDYGAPPEPDADGDHIPDSTDQCPSQAEDYDGYLDDDGCPDPDNDGDLVNDIDDSCPNVHATEGGNFDNNSDGCPDYCDADCPDANPVVTPSGNVTTVVDCDPTESPEGCEEEAIAVGVGVIGGVGIATLFRRWSIGGKKGGGRMLDLGKAKDAYDGAKFIADKTKGKKTGGGSDHYLKPGVERQQAMSTAADTALDDYVED